MKMKLLVLLTLCGSAAMTKDLGQYGPAYPVIEDNLKQTLIEKAFQMEQSGELEMMQDDMKKQTKNYLENPTPVKGVNKTQKERTFYVDPSIILDEHIVDTKGNVLVAKGSKINPLDTIDFDRTLYFIDGTDEAQIEWIIEDANPNDTIVLVKGSVMQLMDEYKLMVYFDQGGKLTDSLNISQVPAKVTGEKDWLKVLEVLI